MAGAASTGTIIIAGTIAGGNGGFASYQDGGAAGDGIDAVGGMIVNSGMIQGGNAGQSRAGGAGSAGAGILLSGVGVDVTK